MKKNSEQPKDRLRDEDDKRKEKLPYNPDITDDDQQALQDKGLSMDQGQDKDLADRDRPVDFTGKNLDIPGREERDTSTGTGIPDEDNYQFNQRGSRKEKDKNMDHPDPDTKIPKD